MITLKNIIFFLKNDLLDVNYYEIKILKDNINTVHVKKNYLLNIIYSDNFCFNENINILHLKKYRDHLKKLKLCKLSIKLHNDVENAYIISNSYIYITKLLFYEKVLAFSKLTKNHMIIDQLLHNIHDDIIYSIVKYTKI